MTLEEIESNTGREDLDISTDRQKALTRLLTLIQKPEPIERQLIRAELERQRDFHQGKWFWSRLLIFLPGPLIWYVGFAQARREAATIIWLEVAAFLIIAATAVPLNLGLARKYQRRIDALDAVLKGSGQADRKD